LPGGIDVDGIRISLVALLAAMTALAPGCGGGGGSGGSAEPARGPLSATIDGEDFLAGAVFIFECNDPDRDILIQGSTEDWQIDLRFEPPWAYVPNPAYPYSYESAWFAGIVSQITDGSMESWYSCSGEVVLTEASEDRIVGTFWFGACEQPGDPVQVSVLDGAFDLPSSVTSGWPPGLCP
jgi:hypothetical protein